MSAPKPPSGWTVELLGLINTVTFRSERHRLTWIDGEWWQETRRTYEIQPWVAEHYWYAAPHHGIPPATTMAEARAVGCKFLHDFEEGLA